MIHIWDIQHHCFFNCMAYTYNRAAFHGGCINSLPILLRTYCALVSLELGLKDHLGLTESPDNGGHDLPDLLNQLKQSHQHMRGQLNTFQTQLRDRLSQIRCQGRRGSAGSVPASSYPHLRYMRHGQDWPADCSTEAQLFAVNATVEKLCSVLKHHGIQL
jgi:hypothetical protein